VIEAHAADADAIKDADSEMPLLPLDKPAIEDARRLFAPEDSEIDSGGTRDPDVILMDVIQSCLKDLKMPKLHNHARTIKTLSLLSAVSEYVKLRSHYKSIKQCKRPCLNASVTIARRMGRGIYFARQIRYNSLYLLKHHHLPPRKEYTRNGQYSLLDNEAVLHDVRVYLAAQSLGTVTPRTLCKHVNQVILPAIEIEATISESTARRWLKFRLGYQCKEAKKGIYIDGHERPDVIKEREVFIDQINGYERCVAYSF
jgi:hypothetical protein